MTDEKISGLVFLAYLLTAFPLAIILKRFGFSKWWAVSVILPGFFQPALLGVIWALACVEWRGEKQAVERENQAFAKFAERALSGRKPSEWSQGDWMLFKELQRIRGGDSENDVLHA
jgi:hypothetical protein